MFSQSEIARLFHVPLDYIQKLNAAVGPVEDEARRQKQDFKQRVIDMQKGRESHE